MKPSLSVLCVTRMEPHAAAFLEDMRAMSAQIGAEFVLAFDRTNKRFPCDREVAVSSRGYIESVLDQALEVCTGEYVLRLDDDERCSPAMVRWLDQRNYLVADHWKFPRVHLWQKDVVGVMNTPQLFPDHQTRLSVRHKAGGRATVHAGSPFGGGETAPVAIQHWKFVVKSYAERVAVAARYDAVQPGFGTGNMECFSLPENVYHEVELIHPGDGTVPWTPEWRRLETLKMTWNLAQAQAVGMFQHEQELTAFLSFLKSRLVQVGNVIEIGMLKGGTTDLWLQISTGIVVGVDLPNGPFGGADHWLDAAACADRNAKLSTRYPGRFIGVLGDSKDPDVFKSVVSALPCPVDLLFIDGDHRYEAVNLDYQLYRQLVRPGGIVAFHDINPTRFHADAGVDVPRLWSELQGEKHVFSVNGDWGGIGALVVS